MEEVIKALLNFPEAHHARKYINRKNVIRATRIWFKGKPSRFATEVRLTCGRPNAQEEKFLKSYKGTFPTDIKLDTRKHS